MNLLRAADNNAAKDLVKKGQTEMIIKLMIALVLGTSLANSCALHAGIEKATAKSSNPTT